MKLLGCVLWSAAFLVVATTAFQQAPLVRTISTSFTSTSTTGRPALVYLPDGTAIDDSLLVSEEEEGEARQSSSSLVEYLNNHPDDFRGPLAVLAAAHSSVEIKSIVGLTAVNANDDHLLLDVMAAADDQNCVKVQVSVNFPDQVPSSTDAERLEALNVMYPDAQKIVDAKEKQKQGEDEAQDQDLSLSQMGATDSGDLSVPYDAAAKLAYEVSDKTMAFEKFKDRYEQDAVADVIAKQKKKKESRGENAKKEKSDAEMLDIEQKKKTEYKQRQILMARLSSQQKRWESQKVDVQEARRQPKSPEEEARLAAKYAAIEDISERAFTILVDLYMIQPTTDSDA